LGQDFNSLDAQRDSGEAYIRSQAGEGWTLLADQYDDGGYTGANMERPALRRLLADAKAGKVDCVVVYKVDRLTRSLFDFARIVEVLDKHGVSFVAVTQQFNTTTSLGRLTLNILLSFAQFEREIISERTRDKQVLARKRGKWTGGHLPLGYDLDAGCLVINDEEAARGVAETSEAIGKAAPKLAESAVGIGKSTDAIAADVHTATSDFVRPKTSWQRMKEWLETAGKIGARFL
jgi:site-specific DNA recombinase